MSRTPPCGACGPETGMKQRGRPDNGGVFHRKSRPATMYNVSDGVDAREILRGARWQNRRRVFDSLLIMLFVLRLVAAPRGQGYRTTLCEL